MFVCKKLNVSEKVKQQFFSVSDLIYSEFSKLENTDQYQNLNYWCVEKTTHHTFIDNGGKINTVNTATWQYLLDNHSEVGQLVKQYQLFDFYTTVHKHNFTWHRHGVIQEPNHTPWMIALFNNNPGRFLFVKPENEQDYYCQDKEVMYKELQDPTEIEKKDIIEFSVNENEIYFFNSWVYHTYFTDVVGARTSTFAPLVETAEQALDYIKFIESQ